MYGMCETLYKKDMEPEELFETLSQALLASVDRDALSGWGATVHIVTKDGVISRELKARQD
jgi:20S proteasome, alpha and beta subunits